MLKCIDCIHFKACEDWARDFGCYVECTFPYEAEDNLCDYFELESVDPIPETAEQELTLRLFRIVDDLLAREWTFNVLDSTKNYKQLCNEGIEILRTLMDGGNSNA